MEPCPSCGGSGGGPFGPPNSAWDREDYMCQRCKGMGILADPADGEGPSVVKSVEPVSVPSKRTGTDSEK